MLYDLRIQILLNIFLNMLKDNLFMCNVDIVNNELKKNISNACIAISFTQRFL